jgi:gluconolactonase
MVLLELPLALSGAPVFARVPDMKKFISCLMVVASGYPGVVSAEVGSIVRMDPALDALIAPGAKIEILAEGHDWVEGPVWDEVGQRLLYSDIPRNTIYAWSEAEGRSVFMKPSGYTGVEPYGREAGSNALAFDAAGRLLLCEHGDRRVAVLTRRGGKMTVADRFEGQRFNSPNDLAVHASGAIYFTDPPYGLPRGERDERREIDFFGVYRISPEGEVTALIRDLTRPNGIAFSADQTTLYVAQSHGAAPFIMAYPVDEDGGLGEGRIFFDATPFLASGRGLPDGLKVDQQGNVWATGPGGVFVLSPEGQLLGRVLTGRVTANVAFGGPDGNRLFMTAHDAILRLPTLTQGSQ